MTGKIRDAEKTITILHFNDVYNIEARAQEPVGGAARFATAIRQLRHLNPLVLFSGDAFNPSIMSAFTKGKHMVPVLNALGIHCAVYGNHDFDCGVDNLVKLVEQTNFPWLLSNVFDLLGNIPLANGKVSTIIEWQGIKLGIVGLVEEEWIATLSTIDPQDVMCLDFIEEGTTLAQELRSQGAEYIIALTHMRWPNDLRLAENVDEIDLILGGHDHDFNVKKVKNKYVIKSGTDFRQLGQIALTFKKDGSVDVDAKEIEINSSIEEDEEMKKIVKEFTDLVGARMETVLGHIEVELDGRFSSIRTSETNLGNFIADIMRSATNTDIAFLNSGTLRSDCIHPKGEFKIKDLMTILPTLDQLTVLKINGEQLIRALENGVSKYPVHEGRFPQVSGISFGFDPTKPPGNRVDPRHVKVAGEYVQPHRSYRLCTKGYLGQGKDGYTVFPECEVIVSADEGPSLATIVQNHFHTVMVIKGVKKLKFHHRQSIISVSQRMSISRQFTVDDDGGHNSSLLPAQSPSESASPTNSRRISLCSPEKSRSILLRRTSIDLAENEMADAALAPEVEGRIFVVSDKNRQALDDSYRLSHNVMQMTIPEAGEPGSGPTTPMD